MPKGMSHEKILREAQDRMDAARDFESEARNKGIEDIKFANGDSYNNWQWPDDIRNDRMNSAPPKPCLTVNLARQHNLLITNEAKLNRPSMDVRPVSGEASYESAQMISAMMKHIEYRSNAAVAYDIASKFQVQGGVGYWRVETDYCDDESFDQEILIKPIFDPWSVYFDPNARMPDKSDAEYVFVYDELSHDEFKRKYPNYADKVAQVPNILEDEFWYRSDTIVVAEYFRKVYSEATLFAVKTQQGIKTKLDTDMPKEIRDTFQKQAVRSRKVEVVQVERIVIAGHTVVEAPVTLPGKFIPIVPVIGEETVVKNKLDRKGHTRALLDQQRIYNYWTALSLATPLPTPSGWKEMKDIKVGDELFDEKGKVCKVLGLSPIFENRKCFEVTFDDGSSIVADEDHLWTVEERGKAIAGGFQWDEKTLKTKEIDKKKHFIWCTKALDLEEAELPIHPYVLGVWLGDGTATASTITSGDADAFEMYFHLKNCGYDVSISKFHDDKNCYTLTVHELITQLKELGIAGNKHIPESYLRASASQRRALLQGLMDTDGNIANKRQCAFTTSSPAIAKGFGELLSSLGIKPVVHMRKASRRLFPSGKMYNTKEAFQFSFSIGIEDKPFRLNRKEQSIDRNSPFHSRRTKRFKIKSIVEVPSVPVRCLAIDSDSHLYLAGKGMVPTHNSSAVEYGALQTKIPYMGPAETYEKYKDIWDQANNKNFAYLPYIAMDESGQQLPPPTKVQPPQALPVAITGMEVARNEIMAASGQYPTEMGQPGNERTGAAISGRKIQSDKATYHFTDNLGMAIAYTGRIILDLIPKIYDTQRLLLVRGSDGAEMDLKIDPQAQEAYKEELNEKQEVAMRVLNPAIGKYEVQADVGPGYATRREEAFNAFTLILTQAPNLVPLIGDILFQAGDFPMASEAAARLRRMVPPQALGKGPPPEVQQLMQENQNLKSILQEAVKEISSAKLETKGVRAKKNVEAWKAMKDFEVRSFEALTGRLKVLADREKVDALTPEEVKILLDDVIAETFKSMLDHGDQVEDILPPEPPPQPQETPNAPPTQGPLAG